MKILVTGGSGYKGSVLVPELLKDGHQVISVDTNWFGDKLGKDVKILHDRVCNRIKEIPKESIEFDREVHGDKTNH